MQLIHFLEDGNSRIGVKTQRGMLHLEKAAKTLSLPFPATIDDVLKDKVKAAQLAAILAKSDELTDAALYVSEDTLTFLPILSYPGKIICIGKNYRAHVAEINSEIPKEPFVFSKFRNALAAHNEPIPIPANASHVDYEAELVVVIGGTISHVKPEDALNYVAGYTIGNDVSARDWQHLSSQWLLGKTADKFAPIGPIFTTAGDIIFTGTPDGVILGYPKEEKVWLKAGDSTEVTIEGLGTLVNTFK
ncbi:2-keto-4-pentenoate hydratase/2-oxohepta-3-ene-1,7-dioic acid hydratase in catechol pathway [Trichococcus patagoniensis]|uniref:2-keto-4-pentenoate hydratase/2-oxohepta-3-ene-1,7-dioic acid hydratase in catechol pathway n=1 Tax=Trichococcus patagoniensis TaxID=382641 RepID=A0A2T5IJM8_9LACT|nr:fumarylacetoacetate hydrolase family protein [Trichococcus patagoniensis]PTQ84025.1 2-keto-4-pentenoate hydratase/2-oxohepta-3-ene-1,7-dioic acid hydratase in catechol pathway [Trichococcus patagoniensis]